MSRGRRHRVSQSPTWFQKAHTRMHHIKAIVQGRKLSDFDYQVSTSSTSLYGDITAASNCGACATLKYE